MSFFEANYSFFNKAWDCGWESNPGHINERQQHIQYHYNTSALFRHRSTFQSILCIAAVLALGKEYDCYSIVDSTGNVNIKKITKMRTAHIIECADILDMILIGLHYDPVLTLLLVRISNALI